jgi:hypothetical protein
MIRGVMSEGNRGFYWIPMNASELYCALAREVVLAFNGENRVTLFDGKVKSRVLLGVSRDIVPRARTVTSGIEGMESPVTFRKRGARMVTMKEHEGAIYLREGKVKVLFSSGGALEGFANGARMMLQVKVMEKYRGAMEVDETLPGRVNVSFSRFPRDEGGSTLPMEEERVFDSVKGAVIALAAALSRETGEEGRLLLAALSRLKNAATGAHARVLLERNFSLEIVIKKSMECKVLYRELRLKGARRLDKVTGWLREMEKEMKRTRKGGTRDASLVAFLFERVSRTLDDLSGATREALARRFPAGEVSLVVDAARLAAFRESQEKGVEGVTISLPAFLPGDARGLLDVALCCRQEAFENEKAMISWMAREMMERLTGEEDREVLGEFLAFLEERRNGFSLPGDRLGTAVVIFLARPRDPVEIERLVTSENARFGTVAFLLHGAFVGFAGLWATFTGTFFRKGNEKTMRLVDDFLFKQYVKPLFQD